MQIYNQPGTEFWHIGNPVTVCGKMVDIDYNTARHDYDNAHKFKMCPICMLKKPAELVAILSDFEKAITNFQKICFEKPIFCEPDDKEYIDWKPKWFASRAALQEVFNNVIFKQFPPNE